MNFFLLYLQLLNKNLFCIELFYFRTRKQGHCLKNLHLNLFEAFLC